MWNMVKLIIVVGLSSYGLSNSNIVLDKLKELEAISGCKFTISSHIRSKEHNEAVGGTKNSYHLSGRAIDIVKDTKCGLSNMEIGILAKDIYNGVIIYDGHLHLDIRKGHLFMDKRNTK